MRRVVVFIALIFSLFAMVVPASTLASVDPEQMGDNGTPVVEEPCYCGPIPTCQDSSQGPDPTDCVYTTQPPASEVISVDGPFTTAQDCTTGTVEEVVITTSTLWVLGMGGDWELSSHFKWDREYSTRSMNDTELAECEPPATPIDPVTNPSIDSSQEEPVEGGSVVLVTTFPNTGSGPDRPGSDALGLAISAFVLIVAIVRVSRINRVK